MLDIISYAKKFTKFTFEEKPFNNIDGVIFSQLPYLNYNHLECPQNITTMTISDIAQLTKHTWNAEKNYALLNIMKNSLRYRNVCFLDFTNKFSYGKEQCFSAISLKIDSELYFVGYRGTEANFIDWKEDLNLSFMKEIPSRIESTKYLHNFMQKVTGNVIIGGHSKGGDLATFSFKHLPNELQSRIVRAYNIDGPTSIKTKHHHIQNRITKLVPQTSLIGVIMDHSKKFKVVNSSASFMEQHNPFTWRVAEDDFEYLSKTDKFSNIIQDSFTSWQAELSPTIKKEFINSLFQIINNTNQKSVNDFMKHWQKNTIKILRINLRQSKANKKIWHDVTRKLIKSLINSTSKHAFR